MTFVASSALFVAFCAVVARFQFTLLGGFDFTVAAGFTIAAELLIFFSSRAPLCGSTPFIGHVVIVGAAIGLARYGWSSLALRFSLSGDRARTIAVASLGVAAVVQGLIGLIRGPGLRELALSPTCPNSGLSGTGEPSLASALGVGVIGLVLLALWRRTRSGFAFELYTENERFATSLGVHPSQLVAASAILTGILSASVGGYLVVLGGSTPQSGSLPFLLGTAAALLVASRSLIVTVLSGLMVGSALASLQLLFASTTATAVVLGAVIVQLGFRYRRIRFAPAG